MPSDLEVAIEDLRHDFAEQLAWANEARIQNVHSEAQLEQAIAAVEELKKVLDGATKWEFIRDEITGYIAKLQRVQDGMDLMKRQATACMAYLNRIDTMAANPASVEVVVELRSIFVQTIQETKQEYDACLVKGEEVKALCQTISDEVLLFTKDAVIRAVTLNHDDTLEIIEWATTGATVAFEISEVGNPEPMSAAAAWGVKVLIKGIGTLAREITIAVRQRQRTLEEALEELEPLDIAKGKVKDTKLIIGWALEPLALIKTVGPIVKGCIMTAVGVILDAPIVAAERELEEAKRALALAGDPSTKQKVEETAKGILAGFGATLKEQLPDKVREGVESSIKQVKEYIDDGKSPEEFIASMVNYVMGGLLTGVLSKIMDPAQAVTREDISSFAEGLTRSFADKFNEDYLKDTDRAKLADIGAGTKELMFDENLVNRRNKDFLKAMEEGEERSLYVGQSPILDVEVALLVNGAGHRDEDRNYVLSLNGNRQGTVKMLKKGSGPFPGDLLFTDVPKDLVSKYFTEARVDGEKVTKKKLKFA